MTGHQYRDLIASYIHNNYAPHGLVVYIEVALGKTVIGKDRSVDVFVIRPDDRKAIAIECKYQDSQGSVDEKFRTRCKIYGRCGCQVVWCTRARDGRRA